MNLWICKVGYACFFFLFGVACSLKRQKAEELANAFVDERSGAQLDVYAEALLLNDALNKLGRAEGQSWPPRPWTQRAPTPLSASHVHTRANLSDIAFTYILGRAEYEQPLRSAVLSHVDHGSIFRVRGKDTTNFIGALDSAVEKFPRARWYYIADDDSFVDVRRLVDVASRFSSKEKHFIGLHHGIPHHCGTTDFHCGPSKTFSKCWGPGWVCGGPGVLVSRELATAMVERRCREFYPSDPNWPADVALACCAWDSWNGTPSYHVDALPTFIENGYSNLTGIALHHLKPITIQMLGFLNQKPVFSPEGNGGGRWFRMTSAG